MRKCEEIMGMIERTVKHNDDGTVTMPEYALEFIGWMLKIRDREIEKANE